MGRHTPPRLRTPHRQQADQALSGTLLAAASGVGFGIFQSVNTRAFAGVRDPWVPTAVQLTVATAALTIAALVTGELGHVVDAPLWAIGNFAVAGLLHFLAGWSMLNLSQRKVGAARTGPLLTTAPIFGVAIAAVTLGQFPSAIALGGIAVMIGGAYVVAMRGGQPAPRALDALPGLGCAFCWALSPIFTLRGLDGLDSPLVGLWVGMVACLLVILPVVAVRSGGTFPSLGTSSVSLKLCVGGLMAMATWFRWAALEDASVAEVVALQLLTVPVVLFLAPVIAGRQAERVTLGLWAGAGLVVSGALILVVA
jgi:drug/metabolite transporter (DMT)-like permease